jgi:hypothetical protein
MRNSSLHLATWVLARLVPENEREPLIGDLAEEYALRSKAASSSAALKWYLRQMCASVPPLLWARLRRPTWLATFGLALAAYVAVGIVDVLVNWVISRFNPLSLLLSFPIVVLIGYCAARFRPRAPIVLAAMMLVTVTVMTLTASESPPLWYRIAYFFVGPVAAFMGSALNSRREARSSSRAR